MKLTDAQIEAIAASNAEKMPRLSKHTTVDCVTIEQVGDLCAEVLALRKVVEAAVALATEVRSHLNYRDGRAELQRALVAYRTAKDTANAKG